MIAVLLLEPDDVTAALLHECLPDDAFTVVRATAAGPADLVRAARDCRAQVLVVGSGEPHAELVPVVPQLVSAGTRTLVLSDRTVNAVDAELLLAGASGHLVLADSPMTALADAVTAVASGRTALHPDVAAEVLRQWREAASTVTSPGPSSDRAQADRTERERPVLTNRERDVLDGLAEGLSNRELAARLGVAEKTVEAHRTRLYAKLGARNQNHAVSIARELGLAGGA